MNQLLIDMIIGVAETKELCNYLVDKYQDTSSYQPGTGTGMDT